MKNLFTLMFLMIFTGLSVGQSTESVKKQCIGITVKGIQCKKTAQVGLTKCAIHSDNAVRCGATTGAGKPCRMMVKTVGSKCRFHAPSVPKQ